MSQLQKRIVVRLQQHKKKFGLEHLVDFGLKQLHKLKQQPLEKQLEYVEMTDKEARDLNRDEKVVQVITAFPTRLIGPLPNESTTNTPLNTWGLEAIQAQHSSMTGKGVKVAILDSGIYSQHQAFQGVQLIQRNFTEEVLHDQSGHGTHCAGTIFGRDVQGTRIGVAPGITQAYIGKVIGFDESGSSDALADALLWAAQQEVHIISMSIGLDFMSRFQVLSESLGTEAAVARTLAEYRDNLYLFENLTQYIQSYGKFKQPPLIVAAAGNESRRNNFTVDVAPPCLGEGIISVGAILKNVQGQYEVAAFSNTQCDVCAPGVDIQSAWTGEPFSLNRQRGTSMAAPHVAGCAALWAEYLMQQNKPVNAKTLATRLHASALSLPHLRFQDIGEGLVQCPA